jgi:uncharacterized membrane protein
MNQTERSNSASASAILVAAWGILSVLIWLPPILATLGLNFSASGLYFCFSFICHQAPDRVFVVFGHPLAVCHRCCGIYWGFFLGAFLANPWMHRSPRIRRNWVLAAAFPLAFDALAPFAGFWLNTWWTRLLTGLLFGIVISSLLRQGIAEFIAETPWRRLAARESRLQGGIS